MSDLRALRDEAATADATCNTARQTAQEAQIAADIAETRRDPGRYVAHVKAARALEDFYAAMGARDVAARALRVAEAARNGARSDSGAEMDLRYPQTKSKNHTGVIHDRETA